MKTTGALRDVVQAAAVKAVRQVFETISIPSVIDMVPGGIDKAKAKIKVAVPYPVSERLATCSRLRVRAVRTRHRKCYTTAPVCAM